MDDETQKLKELIREAHEAMRDLARERREIKSVLALCEVAKMNVVGLIAELVEDVSEKIELLIGAQVRGYLDKIGPELKEQVDQTKMELTNNLERQVKRQLMELMEPFVNEAVTATRENRLLGKGEAFAKNGVRRE